MRVFVTGATGWVGSAVVRELIAHGHKVVGLSRSEEKAAGLAADGAEVLLGMVGDLDLIRKGASEADAVIHTAFNHDFSRFAANAAEDRVAIETMGSVLKGSDRPIVVTSGLGLLAPGRIATEDMPAPPVSDRWPRASEAAAEALAADGVRGAAVRLPPSVHGEGDHGFIPILINLAREKGEAAYIGDGLNRWCGVHRDDAARCYRLVLETGVTAHAYHPIDDEEGVPFRRIAETIGKGLGVPVVSKTPEEAADYFTWFGMFAGMDMPASSALTRERIGWAPTGPGFIEDIGGDYYYR
ncbi:SDR family oxidoreductase [Sphingomonas sp. CGMCC 1.13654]|uniref:SDR family oxidoreductase n=1 Tax=Sphingomonas chungangi TaxID=2683589 RepID=A0A838KZI7_9SPHN|nr:SDR family oxidoreductase [Sphingomonas chungangi]MBA2932481.1 SDR family oxidoreductase [Sphingomonas chungangi]MVW56104.1 NAD-dependent epimerase/dehydratase family protein [Sphingomonas chungangi]